MANEHISASDGSTSVTYSNDGDRYRPTEQVSGSASQTIKSLWDSNFSLPQLAGEQDASGSTLRSYIYGNSPLAMIDSAGAYRNYTIDQLGSIRATTGPAGGVRDRGSYQPFGKALANSGGAITNDGNPLAFAGQYLDPATGLYDMRARNYDPSVGRFTSIDPLGCKDAPQASVYRYARNDPLRYRDPSGRGAIGDPCGSFTCWLTDPNTLSDISGATGGCLAGASGGIGAGVWLGWIPVIGEINMAAAGFGGCVVGIGTFYGTLPYNPIDPAPGTPPSPGFGTGSPAE